MYVKMSLKLGFQHKISSLHCVWSVLNFIGYFVKTTVLIVQLHIIKVVGLNNIISKK